MTAVNTCEEQLLQNPGEKEERKERKEREEKKKKIKYSIFP